VRPPAAADEAAAARRAENARRTDGLGEDLTPEQVDYLEDFLDELAAKDLDLGEIGVDWEQLRHLLASGSEDEAWRVLLALDEQLERHLGGPEQWPMLGVEPEGLSPLEHPAGTPPVEGPVRGQIGEATHPREVVGRDPRRAAEVMSRRALRDLRDRLLRGEISLLEFARYFPAEGVRQVRLPTPYGSRFIDHLYVDGSRVVLRESKNLRIFKLTEEYVLQLQKDLSFLERFPDARVEWRISGDVDVAALDELNGLVDDFPGLFSYRLDTPGPYSFVNGRYVVPRRAPEVENR
jgi:hypothetical protein